MVVFRSALHCCKTRTLVKPLLKLFNHTDNYIRSHWLLCNFWMYFFGITSFVIRATYLQNTPLGNSNGQITLYNWIFHWNALKSFKQATVTASRLLVCTCMFCQRIACLFYFKAYLLLIVLTLISIRRQTTLALRFFVEIGIFF